MKRFAAVFCCVIISLFCLFAVSCSGTGNNAFVFLSVRMKGNGDGTVTAIAQNEFALVSSVLPVTLTLYMSDNYETDAGNMTEISSLSSDDLNIFEKLKIEAEVEKEGYYCAKISYSVNHETQYIQSETVRYDLSGTRIK